MGSVGASPGGCRFPVRPPFAHSAWHPFSDRSISLYFLHKTDCDVSVLGLLCNWAEHRWYLRCLRALTGEGIQASKFPHLFTDHKTLEYITPGRCKWLIELRLRSCSIFSHPDLEDYELWPQLKGSFIGLRHWFSTWYFKIIALAQQGFLGMKTKRPLSRTT